MADATTARELIAVFMPDGMLQLAWDESEGRISKSRRLLQ